MQARSRETVEFRRWVMETPRDSSKMERSSKHLIEWLESQGFHAQLKHTVGIGNRQTGETTQYEQTSPYLLIWHRSGMSSRMSPGSYVIVGGSIGKDFRVLPADRFYAEWEVGE